MVNNKGIAIQKAKWQDQLSTNTLTNENITSWLIIYRNDFGASCYTLYCSESNTWVDILLIHVQDFVLQWKQHLSQYSPNTCSRQCTNSESNTWVNILLIYVQDFVLQWKQHLSQYSPNTCSRLCTNSESNTWVNILLIHVQDFVLTVKATLDSIFS